MAILQHIQKGIEWLLTHLKLKKQQIPIPNLLSYLRKGDRVEDRKGNRGSVFRIYREVSNNKIAGCVVIWDYPQNGSKISNLLPAEDNGTQFNPEIRKIIG